MIPTVAVLIIKDDEVLLVKHREKAKHLTGSYGLPSGRIKKGETEKSAATRELLEETGVRTTEGNLIEFQGNFYIADLPRKGNRTERFAWKVFYCNAWVGELKKLEETIPEWVEIDKMENYNLLPNIKNATLAGLKFKNT